MHAEPKPRWPAWFGLAALGMALVIAVVASGILFAIVKASGADISSDSPGVNIVATLIQDAALAGCALWLASQITRPRPWQFGLRRAPLRKAIVWALVAVAIYFVFNLIYIAAFHPDQQQTTLQDLGAGNGTLLTVVIGVLVVGVAPAIEEFFFRGFFYGALRTQFPFLAAALIDGVVFGAVHAPTGVEAVPPLIALGFAFCLLYEATGSILPGVALHALNNMIAFGTDKDGSWPVAVVAAAAVVTACVTVPRRSHTLS